MQREPVTPPMTFVNFPLGLAVGPWADGIMVSVLDPTTNQGQTAYLGRQGCEALCAWLVEQGIVKGEMLQEQPAPPTLVPLPSFAETGPAAAYAPPTWEPPPDAV